MPDAAAEALTLWLTVVREVIAGYLEQQDKVPLNGSDRAALAALDALRGQECDMTELGQAVGLSAPAVTALVDRLEQAGLVRRTRDSRDRRRIQVRLTARATAAGTAWLTPWGTRAEEALNGMTPAQRRAVRQFLEQVVPH